jgi:hypothetical protein
MTRRLHLSAAVLSAAAIVTAAIPAASAATSHRPAVRSTTRVGRHAGVTRAKPAVGTVKGKITAPHHLKTVDVVLYARKTAEDGSKGWLPTDYIFASGGHGLVLNKKSGAYSFKVKPGTYRLEFNGEFASGHGWGIVGYGPGKPAAAPFGKSIKVHKGKTTKHINLKAAGDFGTLTAPDPSPSLSPYAPTAGGVETVALGTWPSGTVWTYTWQIGNSQKYLSFRHTVTVPHSAAGKSIDAVVYGSVYGKNGSSVSISTIVGH